MLAVAPTTRISWRRAVGAILVVAAGALHLYLWFDYFHRVHVIGELFLANAAAGVVIGTALAVVDGTLVTAAGLAFSLGTLGAFAVSTRFGLFGYHERFWGTWQEAAGGVEITAAFVLADVLRVEFLR